MMQRSGYRDMYCESYVPAYIAGCENQIRPGHC